MRSCCLGGPGDGLRASWMEGAMSEYQQDAQARQRGAEGPPAFRVVRRGYDRDEVDAYFSQLAARLREAVDQYATGERARAELEGEVTSLRERSPSFEQVGGEAAALLQEAGRSAEQLVENGRRRAESIIEKAQQQAEQLRAEVVSETDQVRDFRDGLLDDLGRVHGEISGLLERTRTQRDQALTAGGAAADAETEKQAKPAKVA